MGSDEALVRVTLQGPSGRHDLAVSPAAPASDLVTPVVAALLGDLTTSTPALLTRSGSVLDPRRAVADQGVEDGDLLVVVPTRTRSRTRTRRAAAVPEAVGGTGVRAWLVVAAGALALLAALLVLAGLAPDDRRLWLLVLTAVSALGAVVAPATARGDAARLLLPVVCGASVLVLVDGPDPGSRLVGLVAAGVVTAVVVAAARATDRGPDEPLLVLLVVSALSALVLLVVVLAGGDEVVAWALLLGAVLPFLRLLPAAVVDVPDPVLLELDRLSVTAWTAHDGRRGQVRTRLRADDVRHVVDRGRWLHASAATGACLVAVVTSALLVAGPPGARPDEGVAAAGAAVLVPLTALGLALLARTVRGVVAKVAMLAAAGACGVAAATAWVRSESWPDGAAGVVTACAAVVLAVGVAAVGVAFGAGWRSVRWGRLADVVEALAVAFAVPAALVAAGAVEAARQLVV